MSEKPVIYDENDPKTKEKLEFLAQFNAKTAEKLTCWGDMYRELAGMAHDYVARGDKATADLTIVTFLSFVLALEELPEEGDIVVIAKRMNEIMVMREDLTGVKVFVGADAEQQMAKARLASMALLSSVLGRVAPVDPTADIPEVPGTNKTLH